MKNSNPNLSIPEAVFQTTLLDPSGQPNLFFGSRQPSLLKWQLKNNVTKAGQNLIITPFTSGPVSSTQYHFSFHFNPGALRAAPSIPGWSVAVESDLRGAIQTAYLAADTPITVAPQGFNLAEWTYTILEDPISSQVAVTIIAGQNVTLDQISIEGKTYGPFDLALVHAGTPSLSAAPISVEFVGRRTVLNDGKTRNSFTFALTNMTSADLKLMPQPKSDDGSSPSVFTLWFDAAPNNPTQSYAWALARVSDLDSIVVQITAPPDWIYRKEVTEDALPAANNPQWAFTVRNVVTLPPQSPLLFTFSGIVTDLDPGFTRMYLRFQNLGPFSSGVLIAELEKSPFLYGSARGQGLFLSGGKYTGPTLPAVNFDSGLFVQQNDVSKPSATLSGGTGLRVEVTEGTAATIQGGVVVDVGNQAIQGLAISSDNAANALSVIQTGKGLALQVKGPTSLENVTVYDTETVHGLLTADGGLFKGGVAVEIGNQAIQGLTISSDNSSNALSVTQAGKGLALQVKGPTSLESVTVDTETVHGLLTAKGGLSATGPYAAMNNYQPKDFNCQYKAQTDGIVIACCPFTDGPGCATHLIGYVNDVSVAMCTGGNHGISTYGIWNQGQSWVQNANSITFPVPKGSTWHVSIVQNESNQVQVPTASLTHYFVPFGTAQGSDQLHQLSEAREPAPQAFRRPDSELRDSINDLVAELGKAFGQSLPENAREALAERIRKLVS